MSVDFMIIGAQKCGTTTLFNILGNHPSIVASQRKEPAFFCSVNWRNALQDYHDLFQDEQGGNSLWFEASTDYTVFPSKGLHVWEDIFKYNPKMKFLYLVRRPVDRIISHYMHNYSRRYTDFDIEKAIIEDPRYINITRYYTQIIPYIERFGHKQIMIIKFDDFVHQREDVLRDIATFLNVDFDGFLNFQNRHLNPSIGEWIRHRGFRPFVTRPVLNWDYQKMIFRLLELDIGKLEGLMRANLSDWLCHEPHAYRIEGRGASQIGKKGKPN